MSKHTLSTDEYFRYLKEVVESYPSCDLDDLKIIDQRWHDKIVEAEKEIELILSEKREEMDCIREKRKKTREKRNEIRNTIEECENRIKSLQDSNREMELDDYVKNIPRLSENRCLIEKTKDKIELLYKKLNAP